MGMILLVLYIITYLLLSCSIPRNPMTMGGTVSDKLATFLLEKEWRCFCMTYCFVPNSVLLLGFFQFIFPQWGTVYTEVKVLSVENLELTNVLPLSLN